MVDLALLSARRQLPGDHPHPPGRHGPCPRSRLVPTKVCGCQEAALGPPTRVVEVVFAGGRGLEGPRLARGGRGEVLARPAVRPASWGQAVRLAARRQELVRSMMWVIMLGGVPHPHPAHPA